jgi:hypothetical protein
MKVFIHDTKHDRVLGEYDIGCHTEVVDNINCLVDFLNANITNRYNRLVVAQSYYTKYDELHDSSETVFQY